ncbi:MAG: hypothetical protein VB118_12385 [Oscillospiraceae bacterium]|nr:hypothetical protein [Oscillospiraceae bacterium]
MAKDKLQGINISMGILSVKSLICGFTVTAIREKSAHFCRYSCASENIG